MTSVLNNSLVASRQLTSRPSGSYEINAREYGGVAAGAIGLAQAACQGGELAASTVVQLSARALQALEDGAGAVVDGLGDAADGIGDLGSSVMGCVTDVAMLGHSLIDEIL